MLPAHRPPGAAPAPRGRAPLVLRLVDRLVIRVSRAGRRRARDDRDPAGLQRGGFTLIELMVVCTILAVALVMLSGTLASTSQLVPSSRESYTACLTASNKIEAMRNEAPEEVYLIFNSDPDDDPGGPGTAAGSAFAVEGLRPVADDPDGFVGEILLPELNGQLREDWELAELGLPRDLDGDSKIDSDDHKADWLVLPVVVRLRWQGLNGPREFSIATMLTREQ